MGNHLELSVYRATADSDAGITLIITVSLFVKFLKMSYTKVIQYEIPQSPVFILALPHYTEGSPFVSARNFHRRKNTTQMFPR